MLNTILQAAAAAVIASLSAPNGDEMADFSRVGYRCGDREIPTVRVVRRLKAPKNGADATALIQSAIDNVGTGAILLRAGTYYVDGTLKLNSDGVVLRGEGRGKTVIVCRGKGRRSLIKVGSSKLERKLVKNTTTRLTEEYVPFGRLYVDVKNGSIYRPGDNVLLEQLTTDEWIHAIKMDQIEQGYDALGRLVKQWQAKNFHLKWERTVAKVEGDRVWFDNPVALGLNTALAPVKLYKVQTNRISECGVENMTLKSEYDENVKSKKTDMEYCCDEDHGWNAIEVGAAEHCWVRDVESYHFGYALVNLKGGAKNITVVDCQCHQPVSFIQGGRRYAFALNGGQLCLVKDCTADHDRHGFVVNGTTPGPNVYTGGSQTDCYSDIGPHNRFATCCLYDHLVTDGTANARDRGSSGYGHGWAGANMVFWNCTARSFIVQNVWDVAKNYCIGCIGKQILSKNKPEGVWVSHGTNVEPLSLYEYQLARRKAAGVKAVPEE